MAPREETYLDGGRLLAALGGLLLLVALFLNWYGDGFGDAEITAWNSFELVDIVLAALALLTIYAAVEPFFVRLPSVPAAAQRAAGPLALLLVAISIIDEPPVLLFVDDVQLELGIWLALAASLAMTAGALLSRIRISFVVSPRTDGPGAAGTSAADPASPAAETRVMPRQDDPPSSSAGA